MKKGRTEGEDRKEQRREERQEGRNVLQHFFEEVDEGQVVRRGVVLLVLPKSRISIYIYIYIYICMWWR